MALALAFATFRLNPALGQTFTGAVIGLRGGAGPLQYELFTGWPLHKPDGFRTAHMTTGFWISASF